MIVVLEGFCAGPRWCAEGARMAARRFGGLHGCPRGRPTAWVGCGAATGVRGGALRMERVSDLLS